MIILHVDSTGWRGMGKAVVERIDFGEAIEK